MQWKDPELKVLPLTKADLGCVRRKEQTYRPTRNLLFSSIQRVRGDFDSTSGAQIEFLKRLCEPCEPVEIFSLLRASLIENVSAHGIHIDRNAHNRDRPTIRQALRGSDHVGGMQLTSGTCGCPVVHTELGLRLLCSIRSCRAYEAHLQASRGLRGPLPAGAQSLYP